MKHVLLFMMMSSAKLMTPAVLFGAQMAIKDMIILLEKVIFLTNVKYSSHCFKFYVFLRKVTIAKSIFMIQLPFELQI